MKVVFAALKYDYGIKDRGESLEHKAFYPALKNNVDILVPFWLEDNDFPNDLISLQEKLLQFVENESPDYVFFILMNYEIFPKTLTKIKESSLTINWFCDDAWRFDSYTKNVSAYFNYCITVDKYSISKYLENGYKNVILSQWASFDYVDNIDFQNIKYIYEVSFIGAKNPTREWVVNYLNKNNIHVECFGAGWDNGKVSYERIKQIYRSSKINLNLSNSISRDLRFLSFLICRLLMIIVKIPIRKPLSSFRNLKLYISSFKYYFFGDKSVETIKARNFEIPGCGGFQLSQFALEIEDYYHIGKEISVFSNIDELKKQINYYLCCNEERENIRTNGNKRTIDETYENRINCILKFIQKNLPYKKMN